MSRTVQAHLALLLVNLLYGLNYQIAKGLMPDVSGPSGFIIIRVVGANTLLWSAWWVYRERVTNKKDLMLMALCGIVGIAINQLLFFNGLARTSPINASIITVSSPILVLVMASFILKERITKLKLLGVLIGATGAITLILMKDKLPGAVSSVLGDAIIFLNAIAFSVYLVIVKPLMSKYKPLTVTAYVFFFGMLGAMPFGLHQFSEIQWSGISSSQWWGILYVVAGTTFVVYLLNSFALKYVSPTISSSYIYLQPLIAIVFAYLLSYFQLGPQADLTWQKVVCGLLIFMGVYLVSRPKKLA